MHFYLSGNAAKDIGITEFFLPSGDHDEFARYWYCHRITLERRKCFIVMEAHTRYAILLCGVTKPVLKKFPLLFADCLWRHIVSLCAIDDADFEHIRSMAANMCSEVVYHKRLNKSVQAHIKDVAHQLEWDVYQYGFPEDPGKEFFLSMKANKVPRRRHGEKGFIIPLKEFQRLWCELLGVAAVKEA
jgi:hypothetical protein